MLSPEPSRSSRRAFLLDALFIAVVAVVCYLPLLRAYFRDDDWGWLRVARGWQQNPSTLAFGHTGVTPFWNGWFRAVFERASVQSAAPYFALNIGLHALNSVLVALMARLLTHQRRAGLVAGLTFAVLFCHHEAVGWIASGPRVLEACCLLTALNTWLLLNRGAKWPRFFGPLSAMLTPLAKESGIIIGPLAFLTGFMNGRASSKSRREALIWFALPYGAYGLWRWKFPPRAETIAAGSASYFIGPHILSNLISCVPQMLVPDLCFVNYRAMLERALPPLGVQAAIWGVTILGLFGASVWLLWRGDKLVKGSVAWCYIAFLPFAPFSYGLASTPRYLYVPSIGLSLLLGIAWTRMDVNRKRASWMLIGASIC